MRRAHPVLSSLLTVCLLTACQEREPIAEPIGKGKQALNLPPATGAYSSGVYRNLFKEWNASLSDSDIQAKLDQL